MQTNHAETLNTLKLIRTVRDGHVPLLCVCGDVMALDGRYVVKDGRRYYFCGKHKCKREIQKS